MQYASDGWVSLIRFGNNVYTALTDSDSVDHDSNLRNTPTHHDGTDAEVVLECTAERDESNNIDDHGEVASPALRVRRCNKMAARHSLPETALSLEDTLVPANGPVHDPVVEVSANELSDEDSNLADLVSTPEWRASEVSATYDWCPVRAGGGEWAELASSGLGLTEEHGVRNLRSRSIVSASSPIARRTLIPIPKPKRTASKQSMPSKCEIGRAHV